MQKKKKKLRLDADALRRSAEREADDLNLSYLLWPDESSYEKWCSENGQAGLPRKIMMRNVSNATLSINLDLINLVIINFSQILAKDSIYRSDKNKNPFPKGQLRHR